MRTLTTRIGLMLVLLVSMLTIGTGAVFAASSVDSPNPVQSDTTRLNWTGQGTTGGELNNSLCGVNADPGAGGFQNGATADDYLLWIFKTDGGSVSGTPTLTVNGTTYDHASYTGGVWQIVTPSFDLSSLDAHTNFTVADTGTGKWVLTISHGCLGGSEDQLIAPTGSIGGPCADPAYFGIFDNTASNVTVKFKFSWYTTTGYHAITRYVPGGYTYTTHIHWAKPGTVVRVGWKDPNTGVWTYVKIVAVKGSYPDCDASDGYTPGWSPSDPNL